MAELILDIIERAKTFQIVKWQYRSPEIYNPYKLASQGYQCTSLNTLQCHICHNTVNFTNSQGQQRPENQVNKQLQNHVSVCEYYGEKGRIFSKPQLYLLMDQLILSVKQSYRSKQQQKLFPWVNYKKFQESVKQRNQREMLLAIMNKSNIDTKQFKISFILTIMGWAKKNFQQIQCAFCGRNINIKQYKITTEDKQKAESPNINQNQLLDLFDQHRYFCFWVQQQSGCQIYIQHLYDKLGQAQHIFKNKDPQDIKKIRTLIDVYLQNFKNNIGQNFQKATKIMSECSELAKLLEDKEQDKATIEKQVGNRKRQMAQFLRDIENDVRTPLKRVKID